MMKLDFGDIEDVAGLYAFISNRAKICAPPYKIKIIAGCDVHYGDMAYASCIIYDITDSVVVEQVDVRTPIMRDYKPGLFALREAPPIVEALKRVYSDVQCIVVDGHGIAHPKGAGLATFIGIIFDRPSYGVAKNRLVGEYNMPGNYKGAWEPLYYNGEKVGEVIRTRANTKPIFVSPGHKIDFTTTRELTLKLVKRSKIPEPLRLSHLRAKEMVKLLKKGG